MLPPALISLPILRTSVTCALRPEAALALLVVQRVVAVLGRQDIEVFAGVEVGLLGRFHLAGIALFRHQADVAARAEGAGDGGEVAPGSQAAAQLGDAGAGVVGSTATSGLGADEVDVTAGDATAGKFSTRCRRVLAEENKSVLFFK